MVNHDRRKVLKFLAIGGGVGIFAKFFGADLFDLLSGQKPDSVNKRSFDKFLIEESKEGLNIYSEKGEELFVIDNER
jgi:hypothetical protein